MIAAKSLVAGILVVASLILSTTSVQAGVYNAGSSGTIFVTGTQEVSIPVGDNARPSNDNAGRTAAPEVSTPAPAVSAPPPPTASYTPPPTPEPATSYDAFINFGNAAYADQGTLTTGSAQPWYTSPAVASAFQHTPTSSEIADFSAAVLDRVQSTFRDSGLAIQATTDPKADAAHMLSVVSGLSSPDHPNAVGITSVGHNGYSFIDKLSYANSADELEWAVAHNVAHELMHAFGGDHHLGDGKNLDAPSSDWSVLTDPSTRFSAAAVSDMTYSLRNGGLAAKYGVGAEGLGRIEIDGQELSSHPVPEPATLALWGVVAGLAGLIRTRSRRAA